MKFSIKDFFSKCDQIQITFTEETLNGKLHLSTQYTQNCNQPSYVRSATIPVTCGAFGISDS